LSLWSEYVAILVKKFWAQNKTLFDHRINYFFRP